MLLTLGALLLAFVGGGLWLALVGARQRALKRNCLSNMVSISLGGRMWANDNGDRMPRTLTEMSNELSTPKVLFCMAAPGAQKQREQMSKWYKLDERRCSYEVVNPGIPETNRDNVFIRCKVHGHLGYVDGSVFDGKRRMDGYEAKFGMPRPNAPPTAPAN